MEDKDLKDEDFVRIGVENGRESDEILEKEMIRLIKKISDKHKQDVIDAGYAWADDRFYDQAYYDGLPKEE